MDEKTMLAQIARRDEVVIQYDAQRRVFVVRCAGGEPEEDADLCQAIRILYCEIFEIY